MSELSKYVDKFGAERGLEYLRAGVSFEEALSREFDAIKAKADIVGGDSRGEEEPVESFAADNKNKNGARFPGSQLKSVVRLGGSVN